jgi:hypothetical protein
MDLVNRVRYILVSPVSEWRVIDAEPDPPSDILKNYVANLAAIPAVCAFIGTSIVGVAGYRTGLFTGLAGVIVHYVLAIAGVFVVAFVINALAPMFGGQKDFNRAFKVAAYAPTAAWVAGAFTLLPILSVLAIFGVYSVYLFFLGLPMLMQTRTDSSVAYVLVVLVRAIIVWTVVLFLPARLLGLA